MPVRYRTFAFLLLSVSFLHGQNAAYKAPRMPDGHPNLNGIWQAVNTANWNLQDHPAYAGPMWELGAIGAVPAGKGVVQGNEIPYKPEALAKKKENFKNRRTDDPEAKCYMPGIPDRRDCERHPVRLRIREFQPPGKHG
jgi:hypothetical protein